MGSMPKGTLNALGICTPWSWRLNGCGIMRLFVSPRFLSLQEWFIQTAVVSNFIHRTSTFIG